jgi:hypothetical protein
MSHGDGAGGFGLGSGRDWSTAPREGEPIVWSVDPSGGLVQGPLELEFLRGRRIALVLEPGQMALLTEEQDVRAVFLDGRHTLEIGTGRRQVSPACRLLFLTTTDALDFRWSAAEPLVWGDEPWQALIGTCRLDIAGPNAFHETFIAGVESCDTGFRRRLIEQIVRSVFEDVLQGVGGGRPTCADVQARLARLTTDDLNDDLQAYGLQCTHLAVYTAQPPVDAEDETRRSTVGAAPHTAGHFDGVGHN